MSKSTYITLAVLLGILLIAILITWWVTKQANEREQAAAVASEVLPNEDFPFTNLAGTPVTFETIEAPYVVVSTWASWCTQCRNQIASLQELVEEPSDGAPAVVLINRAEPRQTVQAYLKAFYPDLASSSVHIWLDPSDHYYQTMSGQTMPETVIYDNAGIQQWQTRNVTSATKLREVLDSLTEDDSQ